MKVEATEWEFFLKIYPDKNFWLEFDMNCSIYQNISTFLEAECSKRKVLELH